MDYCLQGLRLKNFRGVGPSLQEVAPLRKINLFIGANNSGKSAFLAFIAQHLNGFEAKQRKGQGLTISDLDVHLGKTRSDISFELGVEKDTLKRHLQRLINIQADQERVFDAHMSNFLDFASSSQTVWFKFNIATQMLESVTSIVDDPRAASQTVRSAAHRIWGGLYPSTQGGDFAEHWLPQIFQAALACVRTPNAVFIPAIRQIGPHGHDFDDMSGKGLIDRLATIQNPGHNERERRDEFDAINRFLQTVTDDPRATLEIPHNRANILVHMSQRLLPLESLGTGIHEIIMLAAFCTMTKNQIVCIEEPEIHLHPLLQRKLMRYLTDETNNQYFIATHSATFIDTPGAAIFHTSSADNQTTVARASTALERHAICADLGYRASDIVQANAIIWVEGPSDRIYVRHWISATAPELLEGLHYSIMFYGGRLLSHLSADDEEVTDFIKLRQLNRHLAVIMDSDRPSSQSHVNATKKRIQGEFSKNAGVAWITKGREIENYVPPILMQQALQTVYPVRFQAQLATGIYDHVLPFMARSSKPRGRATACDDVDKVKVAKAVSALPADLSVLDLQSKIDQLVSMIRTANS